MTSATLAALLAVALVGPFALSWLATWKMIPLARRWGYVDHPGAHKSHASATPYGGGIAIFLAAWLPLTLVVLAALLVPTGLLDTWFGESAAVYLGGIELRGRQAGCILAGGLLLHVLGLVDDRRPLGPWSKLAVMLAAGLLVTWGGEVRLLAAFAGTPLSIALSTLWLLVIINALNFLDNMDGLSAGVAAIGLGFVIVGGLLSEQVLVPLLGCAFLGSLLGFLWFNFPPAKIFMGDAGSLVTGYMLGVMSIMTTYYHPDAATTPFALAMPLAILAVPLYDFVTVMVIRLGEGRHPMQGDQRHFSHRLVEHGLSRRGAVLTIYLATAATGLMSTLLPHADIRETLTVAAVVVLVLAIVAILETPVKRS